MIYNLFKPFVRLAVRSWFKRIYFSGVHHIPKGKPVLLACNHPLSFMDGTVPAVLLSRQLFFLSRSDVFRHGWSNWLLSTINLLPIYREQEGKEHLLKNKQTFDECYSAFKQNQIVQIFSEGKCITEKRLRPIKKGTARLALQSEAAHNFNLNLQIVPCGINYTYPEKPGSELMIEFGKPISVKDYENLYRESPAKAMNELTIGIANQLSALVIQVRNKSHEELTDQLLQLQRIKMNVRRDNSLVRTSKRFKAEKEIADKANALTLDEIRQEIKQMSEEIHPEAKEPLSILLLNMIMALPIYSIGYLLNATPILMARFITWLTVSQIEFYAPVRLVLSTVLWVLYFVLLMFLSIVYWHHFFWILPILIVVFGKFSLIIRQRIF